MRPAHRYPGDASPETGSASAETGDASPETGSASAETGDASPETGSASGAETGRASAAAEGSAASGPGSADTRALPHAPSHEAPPRPAGSPGLPSPGGLRYMVAAALAFSVMSVLVKLAGTRLPTMQIVLARSVVLVALAGGTALARGRRLRGREPRILLLRGVLGFVALSCFYYAVVHLPLADATVIQYTNPVFTALIAAPVLSEALRPREVVLALTSLAGVVLVARPTFLFGQAAAALPPGAVAVALGGAVFSAAAYVTVRRLREEYTSVVVFWFAGVSVVGSLPVVVPSWARPTAREWVILIGVGLTTHLGQVFLTRGLQRERAGRAMAVGYLQIVFAAVWGALVFTEIPGPWSAVGALVIVGSTLALSRTGSVAARREAG